MLCGSIALTFSRGFAAHTCQNVSPPVPATGWARNASRAARQRANPAAGAEVEQTVPLLVPRFGSTSVLTVCQARWATWTGDPYETNVAPAAITSAATSAPAHATRTFRGTSMRRPTSVNATAVAAEIADQDEQHRHEAVPVVRRFGERDARFGQAVLARGDEDRETRGGADHGVPKASCKRRGSRARAAANPISSESHAPRLKVKYMEHMSTGRPAAATARVGS